MLQRAFFLLSAVCLFTACRKQPDPVVVLPSDVGNMRIEITNQVGFKNLVLDHVWYMNANGDSFRVTTYKYYVSNISLTREDGTEVWLPDTYFLVDAAKPESCFLPLEQVPVGTYKALSFLIGVDSVHNSTGTQQGALDPIHGMIWNWNTGYIMAKMEGVSPQSPDADSLLSFHIAGYKGEFSVLQRITLPFPGTTKVGEGHVPNIHLKNDLGQWFYDPKTIKFSESYKIMNEGIAAYRISYNYRDMFSLEHIE